MGLRDLFRNKEDVLKDKAAFYHNEDLSKYEHFECKLTEIENVDGIKVGDVLLIKIEENGSSKAIRFRTLSRKDFGKLLQKDADSIMIRDGIEFIPDPESKNYDEDKYFYTVNGFAFVKSLTIERKRHKVMIDLYIERDNF